MQLGFVGLDTVSDVLSESFHDPLESDLHVGPKKVRGLAAFKTCTEREDVCSSERRHFIDWIHLIHSSYKPPSS
jgi:hypothetical protein